MSHSVKSLPATTPLSLPQKIARYTLAAFMLIAGIGHESFAREGFRAQVPNWVPMNKDLVVVLSGILEIGIAGALAGLDSQRVRVGIGIALFYVIIFPGNWTQFIHHRDALGLDTDRSRGIRLFFQPVLIIWVLWATGAIDAIRERV